MNYLIHSLWHHVQTLPDKEIYVQLDRNANSTKSYTFSRLYGMVSNIGKKLSTLTNANDKVLLLYENAFEFIPVFLACLHRGCIPAAIQIPNGPSKINRIRELIKEEHIASIIIPDTLHKKGWFRQLMSETEDLRSMLLPIPSEWGNTVRQECIEPTPIVEERIIYGQLSSGTTGKSKWINITSNNIKANINAIGLSIQQRPEWNHLSWLPHYHDLGLVAGLFSAICFGNTTWLIDPLDFVSRPQVWIEALSKYDIHFTHAPNFALDLCVRRIDPSQLEKGITLANLKSIMVCAEPIRANSLDQFQHKFSSIGLSQKSFVTCFGMAECTLAATMQQQSTEYKKTHHPGLDRSFVSCGIPVHGMEVLIDQLADMPEGVGEVILKGDSISIDHAQSGVKTGDIGFLKDGELYISGRLKEVVILNGIKHLLYEIEQSIETLSFVQERGALAVINNNHDKETLVLFIELKKTGLDACLRHEQMSAITRVLNGEHGIPRGDIRFLPPASLPKTSSGKKSRMKFSEIEAITVDKILG